MNSWFLIYGQTDTEIDMCMGIKGWCLCTRAYTYIHFLALPAERGARNNDIPIPMSTNHHLPIRTRPP